MTTTTTLGRMASPEGRTRLFTLPDAAFYGKDALKPSYQSRYFVSNYQYIGYLKGRDMVVLKPQRGAEFFRDGEPVKPDARMKELEKEAVYYYQHASGWRTSLKE